MTGPERQFELMQAMNTLLVTFKKDSPDRKSPEMVWERQQLNSTDSSNIAKMLRRQSSNYKAFSRTADSIKVDLIQEKWELEDALESLQSRWTAIDTLHWEINSRQDTTDVSSEMQYSSYELQYIKIKRLIHIKMWSQYKETPAPTMDLLTEVIESHNTLVHDSYYPNYKTQNSSSKNNKSTSISHVSQDGLSETLLSTAVIRVQAADNSLITLRALIDQGSQVSLISEHAAQMLKLPRDRCKGVVFGIGAKESTCKGVINIKCMAMHNDYTLRTNVYVMRSLINNLPNNSFQKPQWSFLENIQLADPDFHISRPVDLLLGADVYSTIIQEGIIRHEKTQPVAQQTRFGWILCGHVQTFQCNVVLNNIDDIQNFWSVEDIPETANMSQENLECLQHYKDTTTRNEDGRYVVKYPFTDDMEEKLGASKPMAAAQFRNLERKLSRQPKLPQAYDEYQSQNYMAECTSNMTPSCYLPHHALECADSSTTALRNEFNSSSKTSTSFTLNYLMKHNPKQQDLMSLIVEYQMQTATYGMTATPFQTLKQLAADEGHKYPTSRAATAKKLTDDKTRLVPASKNLNLPSLELSGVKFLSRLIDKSQQALAGHQIKTLGWTDSPAVNRRKQFVA